MSHKKLADRTVEVVDHADISAEFTVGLSGSLYITIAGQRVMVNSDDLRGVMEHLRDCLIQ